MQLHKRRHPLCAACTPNYKVTVRILWITLLANTITLAVTIAAAVRQPTLNYRATAAIAIASFIIALHQVVTDQSHLLALPLTSLLVLLLARRAFAGALNLRKKRNS
jgi:hypothetical protein